MKRVLCCLLLAACGASGARAQRTTPDAGRRPAPVVLSPRPAGESKVPRPLLVWRGLDATAKGSDGKPYVGVSLGVSNYAAYPESLFAPAPELPACGANAAAARTWLRIFDAVTGREVYGSVDQAKFDSWVPQVRARKAWFVTIVSAEKQNKKKG